MMTRDPADGAVLELDGAAFSHPGGSGVAGVDLRVAAGESVAAGVLVLNRASSRLVPTTLEVPVGSAVHRYGISSLAPGATHEESFTIRTERRGVIPVGPAMTRRGELDQMRQAARGAAVADAPATFVSRMKKFLRFGQGD